MLVEVKQVQWTDSDGDTWQLDVMPDGFVSGLMVGSIDAPEDIGCGFHVGLDCLAAPMREAVEAFMRGETVEDEWEAEDPDAWKQQDDRAVIAHKLKTVRR